jgi:hypothetical protein
MVPNVAKRNATRAAAEQIEGRPMFFVAAIE